MKVYLRPILIANNSIVPLCTCITPPARKSVSKPPNPEIYFDSIWFYLSFGRKYLYSCFALLFRFLILISSAFQLRYWLSTNRRCRWMILRSENCSTSHLHLNKSLSSGDAKKTLANYFYFLTNFPFRLPPDVLLLLAFLKKTCLWRDFWKFNMPC